MEMPNQRELPLQFLPLIHSINNLNLIKIILAIKNNLKYKK